MLYNGLVYYIDDINSLMEYRSTVEQGFISSLASEYEMMTETALLKVLSDALTASDTSRWPSWCYWTWATVSTTIFWCQAAVRLCIMGSCSGLDPVFPDWQISVRFKRWLLVIVDRLMLWRPSAVCSWPPFVPFIHGWGVWHHCFLWTHWSLLCRWH